MSTNDRSVPRSNVEISPYVVGFFDLLNQQDRLEKLGANSIFSPPSQDLNSLWQTTLTDLARFRMHFANARRIDQKSFEMHAATTTLPGVDEFLEQVDIPVGMDMFSDSVILYLRLDEKSELRSISSISRFMTSCAMLFGQTLADRLPFRGAIDVGLAGQLFEDDSGLYGPAVSRVYNLERNAGYPRIVIGDELFRLLARSQVPFDDAINNAGLWAMALMAQDNDNKTILNYSFGLRALLRRDLPYLPEALAFAKHELERFRNEQNSKLIGYYQSLVN